MRKLSISLAARGRPELLINTISVMQRNMSLPETQLVVALDKDDERTVNSVKAIEFSRKVIFSVEDREDTIGEKWNRVLKVAPADVYLTAVDYCPHTTPGFDAKILEAATLFPDGIGVIYNHYANLSFPQINAVTARLVELMGGKIYPELFPYWFVDHWLDDIAQMIGRIAFADIWASPTVKLATQEMREPPFWGTFYDALAPERRKLAEKILDSSGFLIPRWQKALLKSTWPRIEERSIMTNDRVRKLPGNYTLDLQDARYVRVKTRAIAMLRDMIKDAA